MFFLCVSISSRRIRRSCKNKISMNVWIGTITLWELGSNTVCWWTAEKGMVSNRGTFTIYDKRANKKYITTSIVLGNYPAEGCWRNMSECKHDVVLCQCIWQVIITAKKQKHPHRLSPHVSTMCTMIWSHVSMDMVHTWVLLVILHSVEWK